MHGADRRRSGHLVPGDAGQARRVRQDDGAGPGGRQRQRVSRRRHGEHRPDVRQPEGPVRAQRDRRPGHRAPARKAGARPGRDPLPAVDPGHPHRRAALAPPSTSTRCRATTPTSCSSGRRACCGQLRKLTELADVNSDQQNKGLQAALTIDRTTASRLGITPQMIDNTLYDAFGQRQVSTMYTQLNQYHVVMEVAPAVLAEPGRAEAHLSAGQRRRHGAAGRLHPVRAEYRAAPGQPPGPVPGGDDLVQPPARACRSATRSTRSSAPRRRCGCPRPSAAASRARPRRSRLRWPASRS